MKRFAPKVGDLVYFRWQDHCSYTGSSWKRGEEIRGRKWEPSVCETTGFVVDITRDCITTAANATADQDFDVSQIATRLRRDIVCGKIIRRFS